MKITTAEEMRAIDRATTDRAGIPSIGLMENAGSAVAQAAREWFPAARRVAVVCGKGNNGGDGFVAARELAAGGADITVLLLARPEDLQGDAAEAFRRGHAALRVCDTPEALAANAAVIEGADLILDAVLGTGFRPPVSGLYAAAIQAINRASAPVVAVDLPSGADADSEESQAGHLIARANAIVTFTAPRPAHVLGELTPGPTRVYEIGTPDELIESDLGLNLVTARDVAPLLAPRARDGHKGDYGHVLVVGGSIGKTGAAALAGLSALRTGAGLATVATPKSALPMVAACGMELMTEPLAETESGTVSLLALEYGRMDAIVSGKTVVAIGPGISRNSDTEQFVRAAVAKYRVPMVVDADGLNAFEHRASEIDGRGRALVLTPHPGEMARMTDMSTRDIQRRRLTVARDFARSRGVTLALKGRRTVIAAPDGTAWINPTGNPGMATGGSGDVLTGAIAGVVAQFPSRFVEAVAAAIYLHGAAGDIAAEELGEQSVVAGDILGALPEAMLRTARLARRNFIEF